jgi:FAD/FMN-containing dehydrogenase/Fe-S oxidoreductase
MEAMHRTDTSQIDLPALVSALREALRGDVQFDAGARALHATDASNFRQVPLGVVRPRDAEDVVAAFEVCRRFGAPVLSRGAGTSLAGQGCNTAVVLDYSKYMNRIVAVDPERRTARVQPGVILDHLRSAAERHRLTFAPDPSTHNRNTLGGMIGNNSCGVHSIMGGRTSDNVIEMDVITWDGLRLTVGETREEQLEAIVAAGGRRGAIYAGMRALRDRCGDDIRHRFPAIPRRVSGFNLDELLPERNFQVARALVGTEGTCVAVLEATVRLVPSPPARVVLVLGYPDVFSAGDHVPEVMACGPVGLEGIDDRLIADMVNSGIHPQASQLLPEGRGWLIAEFGGESRDEAEASARAAMDRLRQQGGAPTMRLYVDQVESRVWEVREAGLASTAHVPGKRLTWEGWEDSAVPPERLGEYLRRLRDLLDRHGYACDLYGHFGQGCVHTRIDFDLTTSGGIARYRRFLEQAADLVVSLGGSLSGEHGDGQTRGELLERMYGPELVRAFGEFKALWDPHWKMNPGKVVDPWRNDEHLRLGTGYDRPTLKPQWQTTFRFPDDEGDFSRALLRCVGVGKCRREEGGTMCPSYMVLREEKHTTRGRAHLLFEMLKGDVLKGGWQEEQVRESLDLCLSCKGCRGECPVNVDIPTYKAEFLHHYYKGRLRPAAAYAFGHIDRWARLASHVPGLVNGLLAVPGMEALAKKMLGMPPQRSIPPFAGITLQRAARRFPAAAGERPSVILWPDTFNNHYFPDTGISAIQALEGAGFRVQVPQGALCCGRPLYEFGYLDRAKRLLLNTVERLGDEIRLGTPIVVLEPACASVFKDELRELLPDNRQAMRLREQTYLFAEFLQARAPGFAPPLARKALVHFHCHHKATMKTAPDLELLRAMGLSVEMPDSGCCGMAGSFGFEARKYDVSIGAGERVLLPAVRAASADTLVVADGYSCREQIWQCTGHDSLHVADVVSLALKGAKEERR